MYPGLGSALDFPLKPERDLTAPGDSRETQQPPPQNPLPPPSLPGELLPVGDMGDAHRGAGAGGAGWPTG